MGDNRGPRKADHTSTRIIGRRQLTVEGAEFRWWAVGEHPTLVTVRSTVFGSLAEFTYHDVSKFARTLAQKLLAQHYERAAKARGEPKKATHADVPALKKAGWFEPEWDLSRLVD